MTRRCQKNVEIFRLSGTNSRPHTSNAVREGLTADVDGVIRRGDVPRLLKVVVKGRRRPIVRLQVSRGDPVCGIRSRHDAVGIGTHKFFLSGQAPICFTVVG